MKNMVISCIRQSLFNGRFLLSAFCVAVAIFLTSTETLLDAFRSVDLLAYGFHGSLVLQAIKSDTIIITLPILCTLPYGASYVDDVKTGFIKLYIYRGSQQSYIVGKALGCLISGGFVFVLGILLAYGVSVLVFLPIEIAPSAETVDTSFRELLADCGWFFLSGGYWALFGMTMSAQMESKYIAYASPFIFYYILIILHERYFDWLYVLYPKGWLFPNEAWVLGQWSVIPLILELAALIALLFARAVKRRISEI